MLRLFLGDKAPKVCSYIIKHPDLYIGYDVWTGRDVKIMGVERIGDGAVIAAGTVVTQNVPPYSIVGGNPARVLKYRFTETQIEALERIAWWNWDEEVIVERMADIASNDIDAFIEKYDVR